MLTNDLTHIVGMVNLVVFGALLAPLSLLAVFVVSRREPGRRPRRVLGAARAATLTGVGVAIGAAALVAAAGPRVSPLVGGAGLGLAVRLDALSVALFGLVAFVGAVVVQFSRHHLDGDRRHGAFVGGLCLTLASVELLVLAGNVAHLLVAWVATSLALQRLLVFYPDRPRARLAARKKFVVARLGDACLLGAAGLLYATYGTGDVGAIADAARAGHGGLAAQCGAALIAVAALLKSAQFPTHGWLLQVMETPTPVSALLHAGIINAGGFLVIRFAEVMMLSAPSMHALAIVGGFTALFGSVVMLTQASVKVSLAYSTVAQMGFMLFECGVGAFSIAALHIIAHSLYKAHAFLSAGSAVDVARAAPVPDARRTHRGLVVLASGSVAVALLVGGAMLFDLPGLTDPTSLALAAILALSATHLVAQSLASAPSGYVVGKTALAAAAVTGLFFAAKAGAHAVLGSTLPAPPPASPSMVAVLVSCVGAFLAVTVLQIVGPSRLDAPGWRAAYVHLRNGLYVDLLFDRLVGGSPRPSPPRT